MGISYQGWQYYFDSARGIESWRIEPEVPKPESLFKYYALTENSVNALTNMYLYASHPNQFNDPTDCAASLLDFSNAPNDDLKSLYKPLYEQFLGEFGETGLRQRAGKDFKLLGYKKMGIISFSPSGTDASMWGNYARNNGFCVEFDYHTFPFKYYGPFPIHYVDHLESVKIKNLNQ